MHLSTLAAFLALATTALSGVVAAPDNCGSSGIRQRQEIRNLSNQQRTTFINAVRRLQSGSRPTTYDRFSRMHFDAAGTAHGYAWFFSWHRAYLRAFEKELQKINSSILLPYWNWAFDSQAPELSPVFGASWFGGNGRSGDGCITTGAFASWRPNYPSPHCLPRRWNGGSRLLAFSSPEELDALSGRSTTYNSFRLAIEGSPHGQVHVAIGGDMSTMYSPNDPLFYLHHAYVDKIWADWQARSNNARKYDGRNANGSPARITDVLRPFTYTVNDVLSTRNLCYTYAAFQRPRFTLSPSVLQASFSGNNAANSTSGAQVTVTPVSRAPALSPSASASASAPRTSPPSADDRTELIALRPSPPLPEQWIRLNNQNVDDVRRVESTLRDVVSEVNARPQHVSSAALINRPQALPALVTPNSRLTATKGGQTLAVQVRGGSVTDQTVQSVVSQVNSRLGTSTPSQAEA